MKKILYIGLLLTITNNCYAADAVENRGIFSVIRRVCTQCFVRTPVEEPTRTPSIRPRVIIITDILKDPESLKEAVKTWRVCRATKMGIITLSREGPSVSDMYIAEDKSTKYIKEIISILTEDEKFWLKAEILGTDPQRGRHVFEDLFKG